VKLNKTRLTAKKDVLRRKLDFLFNKLICQINMLYEITDTEMRVVMKDEIFSTIADEN